MMHHENHTCSRCKQELGLAITIKSAGAIKFVAWLECDNCEHITKVEWSSNPYFDKDPNQTSMFSEATNL